MSGVRAIWNGNVKLWYKDSEADVLQATSADGVINTTVPFDRWMQKQYAAHLIHGPILVEARLNGHHQLTIKRFVGTAT